MSRVAIKKEEVATPQTFEASVEASVATLETVLKKVPSKKLAEAKKEVDALFKGDLSWADFSQYTPEKLAKIAEIGYEQFKIGQYDKSEKIFRGLTVLHPDNYYYHQMLGATYQRKEKYPEAVVEYSMAIGFNPKDIVSLTNRGEVYFKMGVYELSVPDFDQAIALDLQNEDKWANRARMLKEQLSLVKNRKKKS